MKVSGWGRYPVIDATASRPRNPQELREHLNVAPARTIARGAGRSYGDSALSDHIISSRSLDELLDWDTGQGLLRCGAGARLSDVLQAFVPRNRFLPVLPGTADVSVGGAIAADVHGKNHHRDGCFSQHVDSLRLMTANGEILECSRDANADVFHATCGGMGLTGVIVDATLKLRPVQGPLIEQRCLRSSNLEETLGLLARHNDSTYSVAWLDCMAPGDSVGRSLVLLGEHSPEHAAERTPLSSLPLNVPFPTPAFLLNRHSMRLFNALYYRRAGRRARAVLDYRSYFFPLDRIGHWNRLYGRKGFLQYQFVLPDKTAAEGLTAVLQRTRRAGMGSFLTVLKRMGPANRNPLSFPLAGYTLAMDFRFQPRLPALLETLDGIVAEAGGRVYLAKDARLDQAMFRRMYPEWEAFLAIRHNLDAHRRFNSLQSLRLGL